MMLTSGGKISPQFRPEILRRLLQNCPICGKKYVPWKAKIVDSADEAELMFIECGNCYGSVIALVMAMGPVISSIGLITDLNFSDLIYLKNSEQISSDNLLELHNILRENKFDGTKIGS